GTEKRAAFSARLFLICELSALAVVGLARSSRYDGTASDGSFSAGRPLTLRSSCCLIVLRIWIFCACRCLAYSLARRPRRFCAFSLCLWPSRAAFLRARSSCSSRLPGSLRCLSVGSKGRG